MGRLELDTIHNRLRSYIFAMILLISGFFAFLGFVASSKFHSLVANDIDEKKVDFEMFDGKVVLVVNVASQCGYTEGHYRGLQRLHDILGESGKLEILAFPCNQFGGQEPEAPNVIKSNIQKKYGSDIRLMDKVEVKGAGAHPVWTYLTETSQVTPQWNFYKYLIDINGDIVKAWPPQTSVEDIFKEVQSTLDEAELIAQIESPLDHDEL